MRVHRGAGARGDGRGDGLDGVTKLLELRPDLAFIDIGLPGIDGHEVARRARAAPGGGALYLVAISGYGEPEDQVGSRQAGFDLHLTKPVGGATLHGRCSPGGAA